MEVQILLIEMLKRISIACLLGLIITQTRLYDRLITHNLSKRDELIFITIFTIIAITGTYAGIPINDALANSRMIGIMAAGLIGGPRIGTTVGIIAGIHRYFFGGFTAVACAVSSITEGIFAGLVNKYYPHKPIPNSIALIVGAIGEMLQMCIILVIAKPYLLAVDLVNQIAIPMTIANSIGLALFIKILSDAQEHREIIAANQSHIILTIARQTVRFLRTGLTPESATEVVKIIKDQTSYDAVSITNTERVIAYIGAEADHHGPGKADHLTTITHKALTRENITLAKSRREIGCSHPNCSLHSAIVVPLKMSEHVIGTLKLYYVKDNHQISLSDIAFAQGLADLFSTQLELAEIDAQTKLTELAKLQALHNQINPHFLFNTLNTISSLIRTNPELARQLLIKFSNLFRFTLQNTGRIIPFETEWAQVLAYLDISHARHGDKLYTESDIDDRCLHFGIPSLTLQPIIENAIKHGLQPRDEGGAILIKAYPLDDNDWQIDIMDNGVGFDKNPDYVLEHPPEGHIGLSNVHHRLQSLYGQKYGLKIKSEAEIGTCVSICLPQQHNKEEESHV